MRAPSIARLSLLLLLATSAVSSARPPAEFKPPPEQTEEELAEAQARAHVGMKGFINDQEAPPTPFPWKMVILFGLAIVVAFPFAIKAYQNTAREIGGNQSFGAGGGRPPPA